jgi:hypothetical protein
MFLVLTLGGESLKRVFHWIMILKNKKRFTLQSPKKRFNEEYKSETFLCKSRTIQNGALVELSSVYAFVLSQN